MLAEKNYSLFSLEMQILVYRMNHFSSYLNGQHITLFTNHKPLEKLTKVHTKMLNRLQEPMLEFYFETRARAERVQSECRARAEREQSLL